MASSTASRAACDHILANAAYASIIAFELTGSTCFNFPDFVLKRTGETRTHEHGLERVVQHFEVDGGYAPTHFTWSSTGEPAAVAFEAGGETYYLEMHWTLLGDDPKRFGTPLKLNQLVVLTEEQFQSLNKL